jgi:hypothetical protein
MLRTFLLVLLFPLFSFSKVTLSVDHPGLQNLEVELETGEVISLRDYLLELAEQPVEPMGDEVPWPKPSQCEKDDLECLRRKSAVKALGGEVPWPQPPCDKAKKEC